MNVSGINLLEFAYKQVYHSGHIPNQPLGFQKKCSRANFYQVSWRYMSKFQNQKYFFWENFFSWEKFVLVFLWNKVIFSYTEMPIFQNYKCFLYQSDDSSIFPQDQKKFLKNFIKWANESSVTHKNDEKSNSDLWQLNKKSHTPMYKT